MTREADGEQMALLRPAVPPRPTAGGPEPVAPLDPVAVVLVDTALPHLDRPFEYAVPESMGETALPGARVKVRFAGQDLDGVVVERRAAAEHDGRLAPLRRVVSPEAVLTPGVLAAARLLARRSAGTVGDLLRLALPPRHARAEQALPMEAPELEPQLPVETPAWEPYAAGGPFLSRVAAGEAPGAALLAVPSGEPDRQWPALLAQAAAVAVAAGRGVVLVVPDSRDVDRLDAAVTQALGRGRHVRLTADQGPQARYTAWLRVLRGHVRVAVGTRAAVWAPVRDLGLVGWWDDGDDLHEEPRAPYVPVREVALARAGVEGAAVLSAGFTRSVDVTALVEAGRLHSVEVDRAVVRDAAPAVRIAGEGRDAERDPAAARAHLPSVAWRTAKAALERGPVLVQVPRRGYLPAMSCHDCRRPARCAICAGPIMLPGPQARPTCRWCGVSVSEFRCPHCESSRLRTAVVGARRTAEELGRAFPGVPVTRSGAGEVLAAVDGMSRLVISTPGAEPVAESGYAAALLLDAWALLDRADLRAGEEALRRWCAAAALVRGRAAGGEVVLCGAPQHATIPAVEALVRWAPDWFATRELAEREILGLPPTRRVAALTAPRRTLEDAVASMRLPSSTTRLGPMPVLSPGPGPAAADPAAGEHRMLLTVPHADGDALAAEVAALRARQSARKDKELVATRMDPPDPSG